MGLLPDPDVTAWIVLALFAGALMSGFAGFGLSAVAGAALVRLLGPMEAVALMMAASVTTQAIGLVRLRAALHPGAALPFCMGGLAGLALGLPILARIDGQTFRGVFGAVLMIYAAVGVARPLRGATDHLAARRVRLVERLGVGVAGGVIGMLTALPSTAILVWSDARRLPRAEMRGTLQPYILALQTTALVGLAAGGHAGAAVAALWLLALPALVAGTLIGLRLYARVEAEAYRQAVLWILVGAGAGLVVP